MPQLLRYRAAHKNASMQQPHAATTTTATTTTPAPTRRAGDAPRRRVGAGVQHGHCRLHQAGSGHGADAHEVGAQRRVDAVGQRRACGQINSL